MTFERGAVTVAAEILGGVVAWKVLGVVAAGMVLGGLANLIMFFANGSGSLVTGLLLLGGAFAALVVSALVKGWFFGRAGRS